MAGVSFYLVMKLENIWLTSLTSLLLPAPNQPGYFIETKLSPSEIVDLETMQPLPKLRPFWPSSKNLPSTYRKLSSRLSLRTLMLTTMELEQTPRRNRLNSRPRYLLFCKKVVFSSKNGNAPVRTELAHI